MTHYELLGIRPEATDAEVLEAIAAARASWSRRRDASSAPAAVERAMSALARLDEAAADLGSAERRWRYDENSLPLDTLHRVRALGGYQAPANEASGADASRGHAAAKTEGSAAPDANTAERQRLETENAIRAESERRREARRQEEERAAHERSTWDVPADPEPQETPDAPEPDRRSPRKRSRSRPKAQHLDVDWRTVSVLAMATAIGVGIALVPVALVTSGRPSPGLLTDAASTSETPKVLPVTNVSATISQPPTAYAPADPAPDPATGITGMAANPAAGFAASPAAGMAPNPATGPDAAAPPLEPAGALTTGANPATASVSVAAASSDIVPAAPESAHSTLRRAYAAYSGGHYPESLKLYDQVLGRRPDDPIAHVARALTLLALARPHDAEVECRIAIKIQPTFPEAHFNLGIALHRQHRDDDAAAAFRRFVELSPDDRAAPQARGFIARLTMARQAAASRRVGRSGR